jgi:hypothetical protein
MIKEEMIWAYTRNKFTIIASGATPIGSVGRAPSDIFSCIKKAKEGERRLGQHRYSHREGVYINQGWTNRIFLELKQSNKAATYDSRVVSSRQNLNAMIETYHEGKTPRSVLCGLVYAHGCALLEIIRVYDMKKILVDALGTLRTTGTHFFVSPKCGKRMGLTGFPNSSPRGLNLK